MANTSFALNLFSKIKETNKTNNIFYSPLSISSALAMVYLGAAGNTATQMSKVRTIKKKKKHSTINVNNQVGNKGQKLTGWQKQ